MILDLHSFSTANSPYLSRSTLEEVTQVAQYVADNMVTAGVSLDRCSVPKRGKQESLPFDELEYGMGNIHPTEQILNPIINSLQGIHNEPGVQREKIPSISAVVANVLKILEISALEKGRPIATMVNNLGGLSILELHTIADEVMGQLETAGFDIQRTLVGTFVTSLDGPGFSVTILTLDPLTKSLLNCPTTAPAWPNLIEGPTLGTPDNTSQKLVKALAVEKTLAIHINAEKEFMVEAVLLHKILDAVLESVTRGEPQITRYDTIAGDGDCGETLLKGVNCKQIPMQ